jgi:hypothetical protein
VKCMGRHCHCIRRCRVLLDREAVTITVSFFDPLHSEVE